MFRTTAAQQLVGRERRERVSQLAWCGAGCFESRRRVNSDVRSLSMMQTVRANIERDGAIILRNIQVRLNESTDPRSDLKSWNGSFTLPAGQSLEPGDECRLLLPDGRSGSFFVQRIDIGTDHADFVQFVGSGGLD